MEFALDYAEETYYRFYPDNRGIRAGNGGRNNRRNWRGDNQRGINRVRRMRFITAVVIRVYCVYLFIANLCLSTTKVEVTKFDIQSLYINYDIVDITTVKLGGNATIQTILQLNGDFTPVPEVGVFNLSIISKTDPVISTFAYGKFKISGNEKQLVVLNFKPLETQLPHERVRRIQKELEKREAWPRLDVCFQWQLNKNWFLVFPVHHKHTDFRCDHIRYIDLPVDGHTQLYANEDQVNVTYK